MASLVALTPEDDALLTDAFRLARQLVRERDVEVRRYSLMLNGSSHQEVGQLHFHVVSEAPAEEPPSPPEVRP